MHNITKSDEGTFLHKSQVIGGDRFHSYYYLIKVADCTVACRCFFYCTAMINFWIQEELRLNTFNELIGHKYRKKNEKWVFEIRPIEYFDSDLEHENPLELIALNYFKTPSRYLTKKQQQMLEKFSENKKSSIVINNI